MNSSLCEHCWVFLINIKKQMYTKPTSIFIAGPCRAGLIENGYFLIIDELSIESATLYSRSDDGTYAVGFVALSGQQTLVELHASRM